jgi:hypothetical protein
MESPARCEPAPVAGWVDGGRPGRRPGHEPQHPGQGEEEGDALGPERKDLTPAMRDLPSGRSERQALFGSWLAFPRSPQPWFVRLPGPFELKYRYAEDGWASQTLAWRFWERQITADYRVGHRPILPRRWRSGWPGWPSASTWPSGATTSTAG